MDLELLTMSSEVIISSEQQNLHFVGEATRTGDDGGQFEQQEASGSSEQSDVFPDFTGTNAADALDGRVIITYTIVTSGRPVAFIKPANLAAYDRFYAIISQEENTATSTWTFTVLMSGIDATVANQPSLYCFVDANNVTVGTDSYGMIVYRNEFSNEDICTRSGGHWGELDSRGDAVCYASADTSDTDPLILKAFDSRAQPLSIISANTNRPREYAPNEGTPVNKEAFSNYIIDNSCSYMTLDHDFHSNGGPQIIGECNSPPIAEGITEDNCLMEQGGTNWTEMGSTNGPSQVSMLVDSIDATTGTPLEVMMFASGSSYQSVFTRQAHSVSSDGSSCFATAAWWVMYRGANRLVVHPDQSVSPRVRWEAGWGTFAAGYNFANRDEDQDWNGRPTATDPGNWIEGFMPYDSVANINYDQNSFMMVADSRKYT